MEEASEGKWINIATVDTNQLTGEKADTFTGMDGYQ